MSGPPAPNRTMRETLGGAMVEFRNRTDENRHIVWTGLFTTLATSVFLLKLSVRKPWVNRISPASSLPDSMYIQGTRFGGRVIDVRSNEATKNVSLIVYPIPTLHKLLLLPALPISYTFFRRPIPDKDCISVRLYNVMPIETSPIRKPFLEEDMLAYERGIVRHQDLFFETLKKATLNRNIKVKPVKLDKEADEVVGTVIIGSAFNLAGYLIRSGAAQVNAKAYEGGMQPIYYNGGTKEKRWRFIGHNLMKLQYQAQHTGMGVWLEDAQARMVYAQRYTKIKPELKRVYGPLTKADQVKWDKAVSGDFGEDGYGYKVKKWLISTFYRSSKYHDYHL